MIFRLDRLQVKGSSDPKTLATRFFHFFFRLGIADTEDKSMYPEAFTIQGINDCTVIDDLFTPGADRLHWQGLRNRA